MGLGNLQFAVLGLVARRREGVHGYRLKRECDAISDEFWQINYGSLYRVLDMLERGGELELTQLVQNKRPNRKVYRITEKGRRNLDDWLLQPVADKPQPLRNELALKLLFLGGADAAAIYELIKHQRGIYLTNLAHISRRRKRLEKVGLDMEVTGLVMDGAEMRVRADLGWLEHIERHVLHRP